ncbi:MAG: hypothetical protein E6G95_21495 [Alphaproteobacteria bacterium]|nr:MAG: hypothetical protein E6G95_21495 [Alphaproteobacteria bacterium]
MAEEAHHRRHAVDRGDQLGRRAALGRGEGRAHVEQMAQHGDLQVRRALGHDAVMRDIALHEAGEPRELLLEALLEALAVAQEGDVGEDHRLQHRHRLVADQPAAHHPPEMCALAGERQHEAPGEALVGGGGQPVVVADPVDHARGHHLALPAERRPAPFAVAPVVDQPHGECRRPGIAAVAQIAQPAEAVQAVEPERAGGGAPPRRVVTLRRHRADLAMRHQLADHQPQADHGVARPRIGRHGEEALGAAPAQGQGIERRAEQPAAERQRRGNSRRGQDGADGTGPGHQRITGPAAICDQRHFSSGFGPALVAELLRGCRV